jgi:NAD(P)-dependent dehydrogenase (short-subunit alcohol dehydrogenase family)
MSVPLPLQGKVAIVTGGARGLGRAICEELIEQKARVVLVDSGVSISGDDPDASVAQAAARDLGALACPLDIAAPGAARAAVDLALKECGAIDIVINNAAIVRDAFIFKAERAAFERVLQNNLVGAFALLSAATPVLRDAVKSGRPPGRIVNMVSTAALYGNYGQSAYAAAKAGLVALTRVAALDLARLRINCNAVAPFAATRVTASIQPANDAQAAYKARALRVPAGYVARLVAWLCTEACDVTGQIFGVRGREVFLFSQARPAARVVTAPLPELTLASLSNAVDAEMRKQFVGLETDLEAFNTEPVL